MNHLAIYALYTKAKTIYDQEDGSVVVLDDDGNNVEINETTVNNWVDPNAYQEKRASEYKQLKEQLDLLYHDMTADKGDKTGEWYKHIKTVKDANPKP
tara:strand:+ start:558 stop:851 length:294 start_codon:yes stop_codon:yes gene_type:complete